MPVMRPCAPASTAQIARLHGDRSTAIFNPARLLSSMIVSSRARWAS